MDTKQVIQSTTAAAADRLTRLSRQISSRPELGFDEHHAAAAVAAELEHGGFDLRRGIAGLDTAFVARAGGGALHVTVCAEYDAMPEGHVCGHNLIAAMAVGAGLALAKVVDDLDLTVSVVGTPAEEGGGGKILLLDAGVFDDAHVAMMVHPAPVDVLAPPLRAMSRLHVTFLGKAASATSFPELGIDAADAATLTQVAVALLRQHLPRGVVVNGIVTKAGDRPVVVPDEARAEYVVWGTTTEQVAEACRRVRGCFEAAALATGARCKVVADREPGPGAPYADMRHDRDLLAVYEQNALRLGRVFPDVSTLLDRFAMCTDMGNVSHVVPAIHPFVGVGGSAVNPEPGFTAACTTTAANAALLDGAVAMAWTVVDAALDASLRGRFTETTAGARRAAA